MNVSGGLLSISPGDHLEPRPVSTNGFNPVVVTRTPAQMTTVLVPASSMFALCNGALITFLDYRSAFPSRLFLPDVQKGLNSPRLRGLNTC